MMKLAMAMCFVASGAAAVQEVTVDSCAATGDTAHSYCLGWVTGLLESGAMDCGPLLVGDLLAAVQFYVRQSGDLSQVSAIRMVDLATGGACHGV